MKALGLALLLAAPQEGPRVLFDFEKDGDLAAWSPLGVPAGADRRVREEPPVRIELTGEHAASGSRSLKLTFSGGRWPTVTTAVPREDWMPYQRLTAEVTVTRPCLVGFTVFQEKSSRAEGWDPVVSRWTKTAFCRPGRNTVSDVLHRNDWSAVNPKLGPVVAFEIFLYAPHAGESIWVDHVRLISGKDKEEPPKREFRVLGTEWTVSGVQELSKKLEAQWKPPEPTTVDRVEAEFRALHEKLQAEHPKAVLSTFRDGENGYEGWRDAYFNSHGPDGMTFERSENHGRRESGEIFMRHRSPLHRVDLSSMPAGSKILAARLLLVSASSDYEKGRDPRANPNLWVAEPCARPWVEDEVNAYEWAKDRFWQAIGGQHYGEDPDFLPLYLAHGPGNHPVSVFDFTEAVRFWTDGKHANHGFMLHGDSRHWMGRAWNREAKGVRNRPALLVSYVAP